MLILSGGSDVTLSGGVDEVNRWQKGNIHYCSVVQFIIPSNDILWDNVF